jgi:acetyltransferase-like isoleucine patch superfamily enzyme
VAITKRHQSASYNLDGLWQKFKSRPIKQQLYFLFALLRWLLRFYIFETRTPIFLGRNVHIEKRHGRIIAEGPCSLKSGCRLGVVGTREKKAILIIGEGTEIGERTVINVREKVQIGRLCSISWDCNITDTDFHQIILAGSNYRPHTLPITIEDNVWIGLGVIISKGVNIGHHSVIAAGSVVHHSVAPYSLIAGNPARFVSRIEGWQR